MLHCIKVSNLNSFSCYDTNWNNRLYDTLPAGAVLYDRMTDLIGAVELKKLPFDFEPKQKLTKKAGG